MADLSKSTKISLSTLAFEHNVSRGELLVHIARALIISQSTVFSIFTILAKIAHELRWIAIGLVVIFGNFASIG